MRSWIWVVGWMILGPGVVRGGESTHRLYDGITAFVNNPQGKDFTLTLTVRDINIYEHGPREVLCKVYDPEGKPVVRQVVGDDGVSSQAFLPPMGAWDHEAWYYAYCYMKGTQPMIRWSAFSAPDRLNAVAKRTFTHAIKGGKPGVYRVLLVGAIDHYVTLKVDPDLPYAVGGHPDWIHGHGEQWRKSFVYVPKGAKGMHILLAEYDMPRQRHLKIQAAGGKILFEGGAAGAYTHEGLFFEKMGGPLDEQILTVEVSSNPALATQGKGQAGDFLLGLKFRFDRDPEVTQRGERAVSAVFAPDAATAKAVQGGAIYHDDRLFWHMFQVRMYDWLKKLPPDAFEVKGPDGKPADPVPQAKSKNPSLPTREGFLPLNGVHWAPPLCDRIMHHYPAHRNKAALNIALRDMIAGLRSVGPNDHVAVAVGGPFANMAYEFSNYAWHYWRPAWRILKEADAPEEIKAMVHEAFLVTGDRLAFCRTWERVNGNSFALVLTALRYCHEGTGDALQKEMFETYWQRFTTGGWGDRVGVGPSGPVQEGFGYAYHYASYILSTWQSILADIPDARFKKVHDGVHNWFSYTLAEEGVAAGPWSTRTSYYPQWGIEKEGPFAWKGLPGPDFTVSINNASEFFAARRKNYYALTYHGRLSPKWESNAHPGQSGYGGGMLCQLHVPGKGLVLASTLNASYGEKMDTSLWRTFHLHTLVGQTADGRPLVTGDSEHADARLKDTTVTSSGAVRDSSVHVARSFTFEPDGITCSVQLQETNYTGLLNLWLKNDIRGKVNEAYEMIPYLPKQRPQPGKKGGETLITLDNGSFGKDAVTAKTITIDRGGFGVRIELDQPRPVLQGVNNTILIQLADKTAAASKISLSYRLVPFGN
jgi:hypothetical protein